MEYLSVRNWEKYQHYKQRKPPWIKLYTSLIQSPDMIRYTAATRWHICGLMLLASQYDNLIPFDREWISHLIGAGTEIRWDEIFAGGMIQCKRNASNTLAPCMQHACLETETYKEETYKEETETEKRPQAGTPLVLIPDTTILQEEVSEGDARELFDRFWDSYPRKESKLRAWQSFQKLHPDEILLEIMLYWIGRAVKSEQWQDKNKIPHPSTWLNQRRWEGDVPPAASGKRGSGRDIHAVNQAVFDECVKEGPPK